MPPKGKEKKDKKKDKRPPAPEKIKTPEPTENELLLQNELSNVRQTLERDKVKVQDLQRHNEWLEQEAQHQRIQNYEYIAYIGKKTSKRETNVVTLSDHFRQEIENIFHQREIMEAEFDEQKRALQGLLHNEAEKLETIEQELSALKEVMDLKVDQKKKIKDLEHLVTVMRAHHTRNVRNIKTDFVTGMEKYQQESEKQIDSLQRKAQKEAIQSLVDHTIGIKAENQALRRELHGLILQTRALHEHQRDLEDQRKQLLKEYNYTTDLKKLREMLARKNFKKMTAQTTLFSDNDTPSISKDIGDNGET